MMEAELFQEITDAIREKSNHIFLPVENICPIQKIVWSSFDYMAGPELKFCWEADYSIKNGNNSTINNSEGIELDNEIETGDGCNTISSNSAQFEDIDAYNSESFQLASLKFGRNGDSINDFDSKFEISRTQSSTMVESTDSFSHIQSTSEQLTPQKEKPASPTKISKSSTIGSINKNRKRNENISNDQQQPSSSPSQAMVTSCVDSGIAPTISTESNLSAFLLQEPKENVIYKANNQSCDIQLQKGELLLDAKINGAQEVIEFDADNYSETSVVEDIPPVRTEIQNNSFITSQIEAEFFNAEMTPNESNGYWMAIPDEAFVAKHVLAEQIASVQLSSNPVLHKFCIVAARHISFGSYIFATRTENQRFCASPNLAAFTVILPIEKVDWYLQRQPFFQEIFEDIIARFRPAHTVELLDDLVCRCTREFSTFLTTISALERWPLSLQLNISQLRIQQSHLWELNFERINEKSFIARCITATLICRGRCAVVGSNSKEVFKLLMTLCAFTKSQDRLYSLRPYKLPYSPYIRLQAIKRPEIYQFFEQAANAHWPCSLLDIDRGSVIYTGLYQKHRIQKRAEQHFQIFYVIREAMDCGLDIPKIILNDLNQKFLNGGGEFIKNTLETQIVKAERSVIEFLEQICLMPLNRAARISFIDHFHLRLENRAKSLITYIRDISKPSPEDKWGALSGRWSCKTVRRNLNLLHDSTFGIVLAEAERLQPEISEFIVQQTKIAEYPMNKN
uniref:Folliculin n=1 Tax=Meloidogyne javanica TaxID=6303 RepID=A0A915M9G1_MELJA